MPRKQNRMTTKKLPPMTKAVRAFVAAMQFPEPPEHGSNPNVELSAFAAVMLLFAHGLKDDSVMATCDPSHEQLADILHCSSSTVKRLVRKLRDLGLLTSLQRGDGLSSRYTLHKTPIQPDQQLTPQSDIQLGQLPTSARSTPISARSTPEVSQTNSDVQVGQQLTNTGYIQSGKDLSGKEHSGTSSTGTSQTVGFVFPDGQTTDPFAEMREQIRRERGGVQ